jgi:hypothetical protein
MNRNKSVTFGAKVALTCIALVHATCSLAREGDHTVFEGDGNGSTPVFITSGPWLLDWQARSDEPLLAIFEMRLFEGAAEEFVGDLVELQGTGTGRKLIDRGGIFRIGVVARNASWRIEIAEISDSTSDEIKREQTGTPTLEQSTKEILKRLPADDFTSWRPESDGALLLFDDDGIGWRATFDPPCAGLGAATSISFVTPSFGSLDEYDSIMLADGKRCYFARVVPAYSDR